MDWQSIWTFAGAALSALLGAGLANVAYDWWRDGRDRSDRAAWVALRTSIALEKFAVDCLNAACATIELRDDMPAPRLPVLPDLPDDTEGWRSLERRLAERVLRLPISIANAQMSVTFEYEEGNPAEALAMYAHNSAEIGVEATEVAHKLCEHYSFTIGDAELLTSLRAEVARQLSEAEERDKARARYAEMVLGDGNPTSPP